MSDIDYLGINENFPVAGQDNDTQVFRDNFDTIKTSLRLAQEEITALEDATGGISATANASGDGADFGGRVIENSVFTNTPDLFHNYGTPGNATQEIDYLNGQYQNLIVNQDTTFQFTNFPGDPSRSDIKTSAGKIVLELYSTDTTDRKISFTTNGSGATAIKKSGFPALGLPGSHDMEVLDNSDPVIIEIWRHSQENIYIRYIGQFS